MTELEQEVLEIIEQTTCCKYTGKLKVDVLTDEPDCQDPCWESYNTVYQLKLYLDREFTPIVLSYEGDEDGFKKFVQEEIKNRKIEKTRFFKINREPIVLDLEELTDLDNE